MFTVLQTERKMAHRFAKVSEGEILAIKEATFFYPSDLVNTKTTILLRVGEERWIYTETRNVEAYIHHYSPPLRGIVVYCYTFNPRHFADTSDIFIFVFYFLLGVVRGTGP